MNIQWLTNSIIDELEYIIIVVQHNDRQWKKDAKHHAILTLSNLARASRYTDQASIHAHYEGAAIGHIFRMRELKMR